MDRDWIQMSNRISIEYEHGVKQFICFAKENLEPGKDMILCPCNKCMNCDEITLDEVEDHLIIFGMVKGYTRWTHHGENFELSDGEEDDGFENYGILDKEDEEFTDVLDMLNDLRKVIPPHDMGGQSGVFDKFARMMENAEAELYPGCKSFSKLSFIVHLLHLKLKNGWSNKSFTDLLSLLKNALPNGESLPKSYYEAKKIIRDLGHSYERIHVCKNHCVLFWKEHKDAEICPTCKAPRYKIKEGNGKKVPYKILRLFPLKKQLQRLFISKITAENMRWHTDERVNDGVLRHPADAEAWKDFDATHPSFSADSRNVRLGLASDGFDPFENDISYSIWPVFLVPYNLPPWICMKEQFQIMSLLIPGPKAPGIDIDVFLQPLIDELKELWAFGIETYDAYSGHRFQLHAAILWTINDFPAYGFGASTNTQTSLPPNVNITGCSKPKKKRGRTKGIKLAKTLERGNKFEIIFPRHVNRPVGEYSTMFTTEIGVLVRHFAPLQAVSWVAISHEIKDSIMSRLRDKFVFSEEPRVVESIKYTMARRYNTWRYNLHDSFLKYRTMALALSNPPDGIKVEDWRYLCNLFTTPEFEARSVRNKKNRDKLRSTHIAGTKAFSKIRYDKRNPETQKELEFDELYQSTHQKDDGSWVHDNAREFHENLKKHKTNAESEGTSLTDEQLSVLTFGRKSGYVCGLGYGPKTTTSIKGKRTRADLEREAHEAVKRAELAERKAAALAERLELLEAQQADFSSKLREEMNSQFASFRQQLLGR